MVNGGYYKMKTTSLNEYEENSPQRRSMESVWSVVKANILFYLSYLHVRHNKYT